MPGDGPGRRRALWKTPERGRIDRTIGAMFAASAQRAAHRERALRLGRQLPPDAALCLESAAIVAGLPTYDVPAAVQVVRTSRQPVRTSDVTVFVAGLRGTEREVRDGVAVTSAARTVVDLGRRRPFLSALVTADAVLRRGVRRELLQAMLRRQWTWPGVRHAMAVVREADGQSESPLESYVRGRCILLDLPRPRLQHWLGDERAPVARVDFWWDEFALVGEADGALKYDGPRDPDNDALRLEKDREERLRDLGVEIVRWSARQAHAPDDAFRQRLDAAMRRGLTGRIARVLADDLLTGTNVIDFRRMQALRLT